MLLHQEVFNGANALICVRNGGNVSTFNYHSTEDVIGFRPLILIDSNYLLEKTKDSNGNDAFKIVEK